MAQMPDTTTSNDLIELVTFSIGDSLYGIDINKILGINKIKEITPVAQAPKFVNGLYNLRGQIISIIDMGIKLGLPTTPNETMSKAIIVNHNNELIGLQVDKINDVVTISRREIEKPPVNIDGIHGEYFEGVVKTPNALIGILNIDAVLRMSETNES